MNKSRVNASGGRSDNSQAALTGCDDKQDQQGVADARSWSCHTKTELSLQITTELPGRTICPAYRRLPTEKRRWLRRPISLRGDIEAGVSAIWVIAATCRATYDAALGRSGKAQAAAGIIAEN